MEDRQTTAVEKVAIERFYAEFEIFTNNQDNFALVTKSVQVRPNQIFHTLEAFIFDKSIGKVIYETTLPKGKAKWINNQEILFESVAGQDPQTYSNLKYIYNVETGAIKK